MVDADVGCGVTLTWRMRRRVVGEHHEEEQQATGDRRRGEKIRGP
jgi:hypothetical protein